MAARTVQGPERCCRAGARKHVLVIAPTGRALHLGPSARRNRPRAPRGARRGAGSELLTGIGLSRGGQGRTLHPSRIRLCPGPRHPRGHRASRTQHRGGKPGADIAEPTSLFLITGGQMSVKTGLIMAVDHRAFVTWRCNKGARCPGLYDVRGAGADQCGRPKPMADAQIAAVARRHNLPLVTRSTRDFTGMNVALLDPLALG